MLPTLFISHGSPTLLIDDCPANEFLKTLGNTLPKPKAILVISAHWETDKPRITSNEKPDLIYDFGGFADELYKAKYPAKGSKALALQIKDILKDLQADIDESRGLDHGVWVPLKLIYPNPAIPVLQLSIQPDRSPEYHYELGKKLSVLREQGVLIIGSGSITHNLRAFFGNELNSAPNHRAKEFSDWVYKTLNDKKPKALMNFIDSAPYAEWNHPTTEHFLPLFVAYGATGISSNVKRLHSSFTFGVISMDIYSFQ
jgi:4,5-DOPA dioxygenase extradiol